MDEAPIPPGPGAPDADGVAGADGAYRAHGDPTGDPQTPAQLTAWVKGRVQGVGFRWWTRCRARELDLTGVARNLDDGRVEVLVQGPRDRCERLLDLLEEIEPSTTARPGRVTAVTHRWSQPYETPVDFREA